MHHRDRIARSGVPFVRPIHTLALLLLFCAPTAVIAQVLPGYPLIVEDGAVREGAPSHHAAAAGIDTDGRYVVVSLAEHRLYLMEGDREIWSAVVGTGTGTQLEGAGETWDFSTPRGMFRILHKEKDPIWYVPDWAFVQRGQPLPPDDSPLRREAGVLGTTALYMKELIAIHGTEHPELLGQDVSAGCIRMTNEDVRRLYHDLEVGTPVLIY
jgi:lipoprotein-anchoring transpeptidase ErfK/SrfK